MQPIRRDLDFNIPEQLSPADVGTWHKQGRHVSHFFNALSVFFPEGERFFIHSLRNYRDQITDPKLQRDILGFIGQEAMHGREHVDFNNLMDSAGLPASRLDKFIGKLLSGLKKVLPNSMQLAVTLALEHFTAMMADHVLRDAKVLDDSNPRMAALWRWHALEETEHKAVAYDVFMSMRKGPVSGYLLRCTMMVLTSLSFWLNALRNLVRMVHRDGGLGDLRGWGRLARFLFTSPGLFSKMFRPYMAYFKPGFHPWQGPQPAAFEAVRRDADLRTASQQAGAYPAPTQKAAA